MKLIDMEKYVYHSYGPVSNKVPYDQLRLTPAELQILKVAEQEVSETSDQYEKYKNGGAWLPGRFNFNRIVIDILRHAGSSANSKFPIFIVHGLYALYNRQLMDLSMMRIFLDIDADTRLSRWVSQDTLEKGRDLESLLQEYLSHSRPEFNEFVHPTKESADTILTAGAEVNNTGVSLICDGLAPLILKKIKLFNRGPQTESQDGNSGEELATSTSDNKDEMNMPGSQVSLNIQGEEFSDQRGRFYDVT